MTRGRWTVLTAIGGLLLCVYIIAVRKKSANYSNAAQFIAGLSAALMCLRMAWKSTAAERHWGVLTGIGMSGWSVGQIIYAWYRLVENRQMPSPSWADAGYLSLPIFASAALALAVADRAAAAKSDAETVLRRTRASAVVCVIVLSGAMFVVTWSRHTPHPGATRGSVVVGVIYLITDMIVVVMAGLLVAVWGLPAEFRLRLRLLAVALACIAVSDGLYAYFVSLNLAQLPPSDAGYVLGPFLISAAAAVRGGRSSASRIQPPAASLQPGHADHGHRGDGSCGGA